LDESARVVEAVELDEAAEARALRLAEQDLVEGGKPGAQIVGEAVGLAGLIDNRLQLLAAGAGLHPTQRVGKRRQRLALTFARHAIGFRGLDEGVVVAERVADQM